jgi:hypothetical protein
MQKGTYVDELKVHWIDRQVLPKQFFEKKAFLIKSNKFNWRTPPKTGNQTRHDQLARLHAQDRCFYMYRAFSVHNARICIYLQDVELESTCTTNFSVESWPHLVYW